MGNRTRKIINDPVYGFITLDDPLILKIISHPYYQRLRRINQMAFAHLVYPGAMHTRLHHSLGAYHLMCNALTELRGKGIDISHEEEIAAKCAILMHDIGHGPFSHSLENVLIKDTHHEELSILIMKALNKEFNGELDMAIRIFQDTYHKKFLHQLISGQIDVDRMDYLSRDSFFTGVAEGVIGYDRIIKMLTVHEGKLMVEEKGIYSIEKFLLSRRLMYWQVYLHKTVLAAEMLLVKIIERAKELICKGTHIASASIPFDFFLHQDEAPDMEKHLDKFCMLDDYDVMATIKNWVFHEDRVLSELSRLLVDRKLFKVRLQSSPFPERLVEELRKKISEKMNITYEDAKYFVFTGEAQNTTYNAKEERIDILFKDGTVTDISGVEHALIQQTIATPVKKFYICHLR